MGYLVHRVTLPHSHQIDAAVKRTVVVSDQAIQIDLLQLIELIFVERRLNERVVEEARDIFSPIHVAAVIASEPRRIIADDFKFVPRLISVLCHYPLESFTLGESNLISL